MQLKQKKTLLKHGIMTTALILMAACAPPKPEMISPTSLATPQASPKKISAWNVSGAIAAKNKKKAWTASLHWQQQGPNTYEIRLFGPLGGGTVLIEKQGSTVTFRDGQRTVTSTNPDALLLQETGIHLPVQNLFYWLRGLPAPGHHSEIKNKSGQLDTLNQAGYILHYTEYTTVNNIPLPTKIRLDGHGGMVKVIIKHWEIH